MRLYEIEGVWQGRKIRRVQYSDNAYIYFDRATGGWTDENGSDIGLDRICFTRTDWEPYTEPKQKRKIKLYRYTYEVISRHVIYQSNFSDESWNQYIKDSNNLKLLHTEEKELEIEVDDD